MAAQRKPKAIKSAVDRWFMAQYQRKQRRKKRKSESESLLPINTEMVFFGDSMTYGNNGAPNSYWQWLLQKSNSVMKVPSDGNQGVPGETTSQISSRAQSFQRTPKTIILLMGENDAESVSLNEIKSNFELVFSSFSEASRIYVMPQAYTFSIEGSSSKAERRIALNQWLSGVSGLYPNVSYISEGWSGVSLYNGGVGPDSYDGVHPNVSGAVKMASNIWSHIRDDFEDGSAYDAAPYISNNLNSLSGLSGTSGNISNGTGSVADGWSLTNSSGAVMAASKGQQDGVSQVVTLSGSATSNGVVRLRAMVDASVSAGDILEGFANIKISAADGVSTPVGIRGLGYELFYSNVTWLSQYYTGSQGGFDQSGLSSGVVRVYPEAAGSGSSSFPVDLSIRLNVGNVDVRIEISKPEVFINV